jgi:hypothetical protein
MDLPSSVDESNESLNPGGDEGRGMALGFPSWVWGPPW